MGCVFDENNKIDCFKESVNSLPCGDIHQAEADYFARCLLMPADKFREYAEQGYTLSELSQIFIVPLAQVCARFDDLGIESTLDYRRQNEN